jgi:hypothetical protein
VNRARKGPSSHQLRVSVNSNPVTIIHSIMTDGYDMKITLPDVCDAFFIMQVMTPSSGSRKQRKKL